ncbi:MAG: DUF1232 domain-containing protein [Anaerolineae bacterium]|nr:DUF1232 domain-containing protein [Anaerolineae bacterium]
MQDKRSNYETDEYYPESETDNEAYRYAIDQNHVKRQPQPSSIIQQAFDWGISGSILAILVLTAIYLFSPVDLVPDLIPFAGQADDLAAVLAGSGSVGFLTIMRFVLRTRIGRIGCLIAIIVTSLSAFAVFWLLMSLLDTIV